MDMNNHIAVPVKKMKESKLFYEKLGFKVFNQWKKPDQKLKAFWMKDERGNLVELIYHPDNENIKFSKIPEVQHFGIGVKNLTGLVNKLKKEKINLIIPITKGVSIKKFAFIKDPNGYNIELLEY